MIGQIFKYFKQYRGLSRSAYVLFFARMVTNMGAFIWPMITLILKRKMAIDESTIAIVTISVGLLFIPAQLFGGYLADHYNRKKVIITLDLLSVTLFIICGFIGVNYTMLALFILAGLFAQMEMPSFHALITSASKPYERDRVFSLAYLGMNLGLVIGASVGGLLFENYLHIAFIFDGLTTLLSTILIVIFVEEIAVDTLTDDEKNQYEDAANELSLLAYFMKNRVMLLHFVAGILSAAVYSQWTFLLPLQLEGLLGAGGASAFGFLTSFNGLLVVVFTPLFTYQLRKRVEIEKAIIGIVLFGMSFLILLISTQIAFFFIMVFFFTMGEVIHSIGISPYESRRVPSTHRGRVTSFLEMRYMLGMLIGYSISGIVLRSNGFNVVYSILGVITLLNIIVHVVFLRLDRATYPILYQKHFNQHRSEARL